MADYNTIRGVMDLSNEPADIKRAAAYLLAGSGPKIEEYRQDIDALKSLGISSPEGLLDSMNRSHIPLTASQALREFGVEENQANLDTITMSAKARLETVVKAKLETGSFNGEKGIENPTREQIDRIIDLAAKTQEFIEKNPQLQKGASTDTPRNTTASRGSGHGLDTSPVRKTGGTERHA